MRPALVAYDLHPEYLSTKFALSLGLPSIGVQHHHAHIASVTAEHGIADAGRRARLRRHRLRDRRHDLGRRGAARRLGRLRRASRTCGRCRCPGARPRSGARRAWRRGCCSAVDPGLLDHPGAALLRASLTAEELATLPVMVERGDQQPAHLVDGPVVRRGGGARGRALRRAVRGAGRHRTRGGRRPRETGAYRFGLRRATPPIAHRPGAGRARPARRPRRRRRRRDGVRPLPPRRRRHQRRGRRSGLRATPVRGTSRAPAECS